MDLLFSVRGRRSDDGLVVKTAQDGSYKVSVDGDVWLHSGATTVQAGGRHHSSKDGTLPMAGEPSGSEGSDLLGPWNMYSYSYLVTDSQVDMSVKTYTQLSVAVFSQVTSLGEATHDLVMIYIM